MIQNLSAAKSLKIQAPMANVIKKFDTIKLERLLLSVASTLVCSTFLPETLD
jgi:hypothetical protein